MPDQDLNDQVDILMVDDRPENLLTLETVLASEDYRLIKANSGDQALRYLLDHEPALILMDVQMPDLDGFQTAAIIKRSERTRDIPIIFVTAINQEERFVHEGYAHGAIDYIYKPYDAEILRAKVSVFADLARKNRKLLEAERQLRKTERKERERQITQLELRSLKREQMEQRRYLDLVEGISHGIVWSADAESLVLTFVSPSATKISGYSPETWLSEPEFLTEHVFPEDRRHLIECIQVVKVERGERQIEHRFVTADGRVIWLHTQLRIAQKSDSSGHEIRGLSVDITPIKESQESLRKNKARSDFLSKASFVLGRSLDYVSGARDLADLVVPACAEGFAIYLSDSQGGLKELTSRFQTKPGAVTQDLLNELGMKTVVSSNEARRWADVPESIPGNERAKIKTALLVPLTAHEKTFGAMVLLKTRADTHYAEEDLEMAKDLSTRVVMAIENANLHQMAQAAVRIRDDFLSVASHELKTPLTPLKLQTEMLGRVLRTLSVPELKQEKVSKTLKTFDRQLDKLSFLIDELLDISRMSNGKMTLNLEEFDLIELIRDILARLNEQLLSSKCEISLDITVVDPLMVTWDRFRIEQVIINLMTNAMKYGQGKPIHLSIWGDDDLVRISVRDEGIGIAEADQARIFNRFERAVSGRHFAGLGLGLYIVRQLVESHGGKISVASKLNDGSTFTVSIPRKALNLPIDTPSSEDQSIYFPSEYSIPKPQELKS